MVIFLVFRHVRFLFEFNIFQASKRTLAVHIIDGDHTSIVKSPETALLINQTFSLI